MGVDNQLIALVTGANRGIGREVARQLAANGAAVFVGSRDVDAGRAVADQLTASGAYARAVALDVTDRTRVRNAVTAVDDHFGRLDILVNNAGRISEATAVETTAEVLREVFDTNVFGAAQMIHACLPLLARSPAARIVNVSSTTGSLTLTRAQHADPAIPPRLSRRSRAAPCCDQLRDARLHGNRHERRSGHAHCRTGCSDHRATGIVARPDLGRLLQRRRAGSLVAGKHSATAPLPWR